MAAFAEYMTHDALALAELIREGEVSASDVLDSAMEPAAGSPPVCQRVPWPGCRSC
jgi:amidase